MREKIEAAVLTLAGHDSWVNKLIENTHKHSDKLKLIKVDMENEAFASDSMQAFIHGDVVYPNPEILQRIRFLLDRFDILLLPVSNSSLVWNRVLLAHTQRPLNRPLVALSIDINPIAFIDLKELGLSDFVSSPMSIDELRVRIMSCMETGRPYTTSKTEATSKIEDSVLSQASSPAAIHDLRPLVEYAEQANSASEVEADKPHKTIRRRLRLFDAQVTAHEAFSFNDSFKNAKANVIIQFERKYIIHALMKSNGNIGRAAKAASKHRRAFWELMRKHGIDADNYRDLLV